MHRVGAESGCVEARTTRPRVYDERVSSKLSFAALLAIAVTACDSVAPPSDASRRPPAPDGKTCGLPQARGDRSQMTIVEGAPDGPSIRAPRHCEGTGWSAGDYIAVRGHGVRQ